MKNSLLMFLGLLVFVFACKKDEKQPDPTPATGTAKLIFKFKFDSTQVRLNGFGEVAVMPIGHQALSPRFNKMSAHYIELTKDEFTLPGKGLVLYKAPEVNTGSTPSTFTTAIDFDQSVKAGNGEEFYSTLLSNVTAGDYKWLRISLAYQNYDIDYKYSTGGTSYMFTGTVASFIGYNTFLHSYTIKNQSVAVNNNKLQGYWGFETSPLGTTPAPVTGQAPPGATTVVNPIFASSPVPQGSCLVTGHLVDANGNNTILSVKGYETKDIIVEVSLSTNKSFEWSEHSGDTSYEPAAGDSVVDMGIRGMIPYIK